jgi:hypothetical protein
MPAINNPDTARGGGGGSPGAAKKGGENEIGYHPRSANEGDGWKELADMLQNAAVMLKKEKFVLSFHNHAQEFQSGRTASAAPLTFWPMRRIWFSLLTSTSQCTPARTLWRSLSSIKASATVFC